MAQIEGLDQFMECAPESGYFSSLPKDSNGNFMAKGSQNAMLSGAGKVQAFKGVTQREDLISGFVMENVADGSGFGSVGVADDETAYGNLFNVFAALFFIGKGLVALSGEGLMAWASASLQLLIRRSGSYTAEPESGPWQAGLAAPSAPIITAVTPPAGQTGQVNGVVSVVIWRIRSTSGGNSNASPISNIIGPVNQSVEIEFPFPDSNGQDAWGIGVTKAAEGRVGSHFELMEFMESELAGITAADVVTTTANNNITSAAGGFTVDMIGWKVQLVRYSSPGVIDWQLVTYVTARPDSHTLTLNDTPLGINTGVHLIAGDRKKTVEWRTGDLINKRFAPTRSFPPPQALFAGTEEDVLFVDGAYADASTATGADNPGTALAPSEPGRPESFSPDTVIFTSDSPTALVRGDGVHWRMGRNSVHSVEYLGGEKPISMSVVWQGVGVQFQGQACVGEGGRLYLWPASRGLIRMGQDGLPDMLWASAISDDLIGCTDESRRILGYDGISQCVVVCYEKTIWPYFTALAAWGAPLDLTETGIGNIRSTVTLNGQLLLGDDVDGLWDFNVGSGSLMKIRTPWQRSSQGMDTIAMVLASVRADNIANPVVVDVFADGDETTSASTISVTLPRTGYQRLPAVWPNVIDCEMHALQVTIRSTTPTGDCGVEHMASYGDSNGRLA